MFPTTTPPQDPATTLAVIQTIGMLLALAASVAAILRSFRRHPSIDQDLQHFVRRPELEALDTRMRAQIESIRGDMRGDVKRLEDHFDKVANTIFDRLEDHKDSVGNTLREISNDCAATSANARNAAARAEAASAAAISASHAAESAAKAARKSVGPGGPA